MKVGDAVRFGEPNGSYGLIESENHYGGYYVRWYYGKDVKGEDMTALSSVRPNQLVKISMEEFNRVRNRRGWGDEESAPQYTPVTDFMEQLHIQNASRGKRWHPSGLVSWSLSDWFAATMGEVGELGAATINMTQAVYSAYADLSSRTAIMGNTIKKLNRARDGLIGNKNKETVEALQRAMAMEAADVLIYLELFAQVAGFDLVEATREKFNMVSVRNGFPERL